jgi:hypothetical protein
MMFWKFHSPNICTPLEQRVLADFGVAAEHQRVVDFDTWMLHAESQPRDDVVDAAGIDARQCSIQRVAAPGCRVRASAAGGRS